MLKFDAGASCEAAVPEKSWCPVKFSICWERVPSDSDVLPKVLGSDDRGGRLG